MTQSSESPSPPDRLPESVAGASNELTSEDLRRAIVHAQKLLRWRPDNPTQIAVHPGEDVLKVNERETHTEVVKTVPCGEDCPDCPHGPYLYHVTEENRPEGGSHTHWRFIGEVATDG